MEFLYSFFLKLLYPTSLAVLLLFAFAMLRNRKLGRRICFWTAISIIMICGNGWLVRGMTRHLERQHLPPQPVPEADCILVLSGGIQAKIAPRSEVEVGEAGDRMLYGAYLFKQGKAPWVLCTGGVATGGLAPRAASEEMAEFMTGLGIPREKIILESKSSNTRQHAANLLRIFQDRQFKRVLLVTSALHMPRSVGVFRHGCPDVEFIPAPTDFRITDPLPTPWYREIVNVVPTPSNLAQFSESMHEYLGIAYYRLRGWI